MKALKERMERFFFGHWRRWWLDRHVKKFAWAITITADQLLYTKNAYEYREHIKKEAAYQITLAMMKEGMIVFEERDDLSSLAKIITAHTYIFRSHPLGD